MNKHVFRNWKIVDSNRGCDNAFTILRDQVYHGDCIDPECRIGPYAIMHAVTKKFFDHYDEEISLSPKDTSSDWLILTPDFEQERKNTEIRNLVKESNCSGLGYNRIDHMTFDEIFDYLTSNLDNDQKYKILEYFYKNKLYKTK